MSNFRSDIFWIYISYLNSALVDLKIHDRLIPIWNYFIEEELIITHLNWNFLVETVHSFAKSYSTPGISLKILVLESAF